MLFSAAELLLEYSFPVVAAGKAHRARTWGAPAGDRTVRWHAWIEFTPVHGGASLRTLRETMQPNRTCTVYWATGLRLTYLEGALQRARDLARMRPAVTRA